jgi:heat shock protein HtpX
VVLFRHGISPAHSSEDRGKGGGGLAIVIAIVLIAVAWLLSLLIRFALSRSREFLADAGSVELTKNPDAMISALRKIEGRGELQGATSAVMEMCVDNPREGFADLFSTHPSVESRVKALVETAGGHDPGPLELPPPDEAEPADALPGETQAGPWGSGDQPPPPAGPWGPTPPDRPFLPDRPPIDPGGPWGKPGG